MSEQQLRPEKAEKPIEPPAKKSAPLHDEAFRLMLFVSKDWRTVETIWNSRDGVTPFKVLARDGRTALTHVLWGGDPYAPFHVPAIGERIFVDMEPEEAQRLAERTVARFWSDTDGALRQTYKTQVEAIAGVRAEMDKPGTPSLFTVDAEFQRDALRRRDEYGQRLKRAHLDAKQGLPDRVAGGEVGSG